MITIPQLLLCPVIALGISGAGYLMGLSSGYIDATCIIGGFVYGFMCAKNNLNKARRP